MEQEYGSLYTNPAQKVGDMLPVELVVGQFIVPDHVPDEEEIQGALG